MKRLANELELSKRRVYTSQRDCRNWSRYVLRVWNISIESRFVIGSMARENVTEFVMAVVRGGHVLGCSVFWELESGMHHADMTHTHYFHFTLHIAFHTCNACFYWIWLRTLSFTFLFHYSFLWCNFLTWFFFKIHWFLRVILFHVSFMFMLFFPLVNNLLLHVIIFRSEMAMTNTPGPPNHVLTSAEWTISRNLRHLILRLCLLWRSFFFFLFFLSSEHTGH